MNPFWDNLRDTSGESLTREALERAFKQIRLYGERHGPLFFRSSNEQGVSTKSAMMDEEMCECGDLPADDCMCDEFDLSREEDDERD